MNDAQLRAMYEQINKYTGTSRLNPHFNAGYKAGFKAACEWRDSQVGEPVGYLYHDGPTPEQIPGDMMGTVCFSRKKLFHARNETPLYAAPPTAQINQQLTALLEKSLHWLDGLCDAGPLGQQYPSDELTQFLDEIKSALTAAKSGDV